MNLKRYLLLPTLLVGLIACNKNDEVPDSSVEEGVPTYINFTVYLPGAYDDTRALPEDYNPDGTYEGKDAVVTLDIYMVSSNGTIEAKRFTGSDVSSNGIIVSPSQPFRTISGTKTIYAVINNPGPLQTTISSDTATVALNEIYATTLILNGVEYDLNTMTGKVTSVIIEPDIPEQGVVNGQNRIPIQVTRVVSKVIVTTTANNQITATDGTPLGTVSNVTYSVAQGANRVHFLEQPNYESWGYNYVPVLGNYINTAFEYYDYSDLSTPEAVPARPAAGDGYKSLPGKFLLENTHVSGTLATTGYRKGNTAYVLVQTVFTPAPTAIADGGELTNGTFYVGQSDGNIYSTKVAAQTAVQNQKVATYQQGKMLYYAWLNPDNIQRPLNSPVVRNNIYHINITGFAQLGTNWNPLYPEDPDTGNPSNPDPKPVNPDEPDPPIDPIDPLTPEETYMTVEVTTLDWTVHSYNLELQ